MNTTKSTLTKFARVSLIAIGITFLFGMNAEATPPGHVNVIIQFKKSPGASEENLVKKYRGRVTAKFQIVPAVSATLPAAAVANLKRERGVVSVEPDGVIEAHDLGKTWGVKRIGCGPVHAGTFGEKVVPVLGSGVRVAIVDSGIDYTHPELLANYAGGYDFVNKDADPYDDHGHGTHVAGTVAALRNSVGAVGAAPEADLCGLKVLGGDGSGSWSWIISALDWCVNNQVAVANFSLGSSGHPGSTVENAFKNAAAAGLLMVASAGNAGAGTDTVGYPAKFPTVIAVASTTSSDQRSSFSSTGPAVELAAPGSSIYSTLRGGGFGYMSGTSMAAPHVAGVAALVIAAGTKDSAEVRTLLQVTAEDLGAAGVDPEFGHGLVNAEYAVLLAYDSGSEEPPTEPEPEPEPTPVFDAPSNLTGSVSSNSVSLTWTDNSNVEEGFQIQYGVKQGSKVNWQNWTSVGADETSHSASMSSGTYQFRVRAFTDNSSSFTNWSNQIQLKVGSTTTSKPRKR